MDPQPPGTWSMSQEVARVTGGVEVEQVVLSEIGRRKENIHSGGGRDKKWAFLFYLKFHFKLLVPLPSPPCPADEGMAPETHEHATGFVPFSCRSAFREREGERTVNVWVGKEANSTLRFQGSFTILYLVYQSSQNNTYTSRAQKLALAALS